MNCAPCITRLFSGHLACPVPEKGVSGTEYPFRTVEACFLHRMPQKMRRVPEEAFLSTARIFRTVGGPLRYRILRMPEKRRALPALNASSDRKEKGIACTEFIKLPEKRRALSGTCPGMPPRARKSQPPSPKHTGKQHHNSKAHHSYTLGQQKAPPIQNTTSIHSHPQAVRKVRFSKCNRPSGPFWQG